MSPAVAYLDLDDFLAIAASRAVLDTSPEAALAATRVELAILALIAPAATFGGEEFYPEVEVKAAILASRLIRNHPLPDGNKRVAWLAMRIFLALNGRDWSAAGDSVEDVVEVIRRLAPREMSEGDFVDWVRARVS